jgi:hypothetical protein
MPSVKVHSPTLQLLDSLLVCRQPHEVLYHLKRADARVIEGLERNRVGTVDFLFPLELQNEKGAASLLVRVEIRPLNALHRILEHTRFKASRAWHAKRQHQGGHRPPPGTHAMLAG